MIGTFCSLSLSAGLCWGLASFCPLSLPSIRSQILTFDAFCKLGCTYRHRDTLGESKNVLKNVILYVQSINRPYCLECNLKEFFNTSWHCHMNSIIIYMYYAHMYVYKYVHMTIYANVYTHIYFAGVQILKISYHFWNFIFTFVPFLTYLESQTLAAIVSLLTSKPQLLKVPHSRDKGEGLSLQVSSELASAGLAQAWADSFLTALWPGEKKERAWGLYREGIWTSPSPNLRVIASERPWCTQLCPPYRGFMSGECQGNDGQWASRRT